MDVRKSSVHKFLRGMVLSLTTHFVQYVKRDDATPVKAQTNLQYTYSPDEFFALLYILLALTLSKCRCR